MLGGDALAVFATAVALGLVHGAEPGHGWPIAATYALDRERKWLHGFAASALLGAGHLVSSLAVVGAFFLAKSHFDLARLNEPIVLEGVRLGGPLGVVAGVLLVLLGVREYRRGGGHDHGGEDTHSHDHAHDGSYSHDHSHTESGVLARLRGAVPGLGSHEHPTVEDLDRAGLLGIVWTAFVLGFVHEEEVEIVGLCLGSTHCLGLVLAYAVAVLVALVGLTLLLVAGYYRYEERVEALAGYFPAISAAVLVGIGLAFVLGVA